jgi:hypothetical protein
MLNNISSLLHNIGNTRPLHITHARTEKIYEIYILTLILRALNSIGAMCDARDSHDNQTNRLILRGAPGLIYSPTTNASFIDITYNNERYELHNGIRVMGKSDILHELDICILTKREAERCRFHSVNPSHTKIRLLIECKYYGVDLPLRIGREYLGLSSEFQVRVKTLVSNIEDVNILKLLNSHRGTFTSHVYTGAQNNVEEMVGWVANELRNSLNR